MTVDATDSLLPPMAWLRLSGWGRDVVRYTRDPDATVPRDIGWDLATMIHEDPVDASVIRARYERFLGGLDYERVASLRTIERDAAVPMFVGTTREMEIAREVAVHALADHPVVAIGPELGTQHRADPGCDPTLAELRSLVRTVYVVAEGTDALSCDGLPLHGILIASDQIDGIRYVTITPMSAAMPDLSAPAGYADVIVVPEGDDDTTLSHAIRTQFADTVKEIDESFEEGVDAKRAEDAQLPSMLRASSIARDEERRLTAAQIAATDGQIDAWARIVGGALRCMAGQGPAAVATWQAGAPATDVSRADAGGTGARKAEQRLRAAGWLKIRRHEIGQTATAAEPLPPPAPPAVRTAPSLPAVSIAPTAPKEKPVPPRRLRRMQRNAERSGPRETQPATVDPTESAVTDAGTMAEGRVDLQEIDMPVEPETGPGTASDIIQTPSVPVEDPELLPIVDQANRATFKDLPPLDHRNWETTVPPALSSMIIRRARVHQMERETDDATRRRLAADLLPRLAGAPDLLKRLQAEKDANPSLRRAFSVGTASMMRDVDLEIAATLIHPVHAVVEDDLLSETLLFPGVRRHPNPLGRAVTLVTAWREGSVLHLIGSMHEGCMIGFRRIEFDLDALTVESFDSDADVLSDGDLLDRLWAPVADALLGPVDPWEQWRWERRGRSQIRTTGENRAVVDAIASGTCLPSATPAPVVEPAQEEAFATWDLLSWPTSDDDVPPAASSLAEGNAVARVVVSSVSAGGDLMPAEIRAAAVRHLRSLAGSPSPRLVTLASPDVDEENLTDLPDGDGIVVVTDRALFEHASPGIAGMRESRRETPLCILYRLRRDGISALILQVAPDGRLNLAQWARVTIAPAAGDSDLAWYVRGAIGLALRGGTASRAEKAQSVATGIALPASEVQETPRLLEPSAAERREEESPRRIVAQARLRPASMAEASRTAAAWFDATAERHRMRIVSHQRTEGDWTIEHRSEDRLNPSIWSTTIRLAADGESLDVIVRSTIQSGVKPRLPMLVRDIVEATPTDGPDGRLSTDPNVVETRADLNRLLRDLQSPDRVLPILLMSEIKNGGGWMRDPREVVRQSLGALTVWLLPDRQTYEVSDALGQEYRTFDGAVRIFQPRFDADVDMPSRHPRIMLGTGSERSLGDLISRATAATTTRYPIVDAPRQRAQHADAPTAPAGPATSRPVTPAPTALMRPVAAERPVATPAAMPQPARSAPVQAPSHPTPVPTPPAPVPVAARQVVASSERQEHSSRPTPAATPAPAIAPTPEPAAEIDAAQLARLVDEAVERRLAAILQEMRAHEPPAPVEPVEPRLDLEEPEAPQPAAPTRDEIREMIAAAASTRPEPVAQPPLDIAPLTAAIAGLVGRMDAMLAARPATVETPAPAVPHDPTWASERAQYDELLSEAGNRVAENQERADVAETQRDEALAEIQRLRAALSTQRRDDEVAGVARESSWPDSLDDLADWLETNPLPNVAVSTKAWRGMRKVPFRDMGRLCRTLQLLDGPYIDMRAGADGARERWEQGLQELRLENKKQTQMGKSIRGGAEYSFQHDGQRWEMDFHIRGTESLHNDHARLIRIYFAYDAKEGRVIIGHMPTHLTTIDS